LRKHAQDDRFLIYGVYSNIIEDIKHYDVIQTSLRMLTSTLLLAIYAAIGFLFSLSSSTLHFDNILGAIFISLLGVGLITVICILDLVFQERLLIANLAEALKLEEGHEWLPKIHQRMLHGGSYYAAPNRKVLFYIGCGSSLLLVSGLALCYFIEFENLVLTIATMVSTMFLILIYAYALLKITGKFENLIRKVVYTPRNNKKEHKNGGN